MEHYLRVARALALLSGTSLAACGEAPSKPAESPKPQTSTSVAPRSMGSADDDAPSLVQGDPTVGSGPCRCSWDTKESAAPRVCRTGEQSYAGMPCVRGNRPKYPIAIGPLDPPDLPA